MLSGIWQFIPTLALSLSTIFDPDPNVTPLSMLIFAPIDLNMFLQDILLMCFEKEPRGCR